MNPHQMEDAIFANDVVRVATLLEGGADPDGDDADGICFLESALSLERTDVVRLMHSFGADINRSSEGGRTPLHRVVSGSDTNPMVQVLIELGADLDARDDRGWTPVHLAAAYGYILDLRLLLNAGADASAVTTDGRTAFDLASVNGHQEAASLLMPN